MASDAAPGYVGASGTASISVAAQPVRKSLTTLQYGLIGGAAGTLEVLINQPLVAVKNALQERRPVPMNPAVLYRGVVVNAGSIAPITAVQFAVNGCASTGALSRALRARPIC